MPITSVKVWPIQGKSTIKANCKVVLDEKFAFSATVRQGDKGLWIALPRHSYEKDGETKWFDDVACISKEARQELTNSVISAYNQEVGNGPTDQGDASGPDNQNKESIPF